ncbi:helix-turn-helix domain-containing protein [Acinetobacter indicus]|uniref:helix-turn-helix domain-containing protein n=1 Tax=Acinetobacter indicus TaxID=756892 RepID=UPI001E62F99F|nr:helix-turn-helix domain-containing protein [Acinetobacter indicus]
MNSYGLICYEIDGLMLLSTTQAAQIMGLKPQTLRKWAMDGSGPIQPIKIGNRLKWKRLCCTNLSVKGFSAI